MKFAYRLIVLLIFVVAPLACQTATPLGPMRITTLAPDLEYLPPERVRTAMWVLAAEIGHLEQLLTNPTDAERDSMKTAIQATLERMRIAARTLDQPGRSTQHPVLNQNLERFINRIERAKRAADRDPPNYYPASTIAGSCFLCHGGTAGASAPRSESSGRKG